MGTSLISRRWLLISAVTAVLIMTFLVGTPLLIKHLAKQWLLENGGHQVQFRNVDFNPFTASLLLEDLDVRVDEETTLSFESAGLEVAWLPLLRKQIEIQALQLSGFRIIVDNREQLTIGGISLPQAEAEAQSAEPSDGTGWLSGVDSLTLRDVQVSYRDAKLETDIVLEALLLTRLAQWAPDQAAHLEASGTINSAPFTLNAELAPLAEQPDYRGTLSIEKLALGSFANLARPQLDTLQGLAALDSEFSLQTSKDGLSLTHKGRLAVGELKLAREGLDLDNGNTDWNGEFSLTQSAEGLRVSHSGGLQLDDLRLLTGGNQITNQSLAWDGTSAVQLHAGSSAMALQTEGTLSLQNSAAQLQQPPLYIEQEGFSHTGSLSFASGEPRPLLTLSSNSKIQALRVAAEQRTVKLFDVEQLKFDGLQVDALDKLALDAVVAEDLYLAQPVDEDQKPDPANAFLHIATARFDKPAYADKLLSIDSIEYQDWHTRLRRNPQGEWRMVRLLGLIKRLAQSPEPESPQDEQASNAETDAEPPAEPVKIVVDRFEASRGSSLTFVDESVKPVYRAELTLHELKVENLDSREPGNTTLLTLDSHMGKHTRIGVQGKLQPFQQPLGLDLKGNINAMDLPKLSSYTRDGLGLVLNSGTLDAELGVQTSAEALDGKAVLKLHQLELKTVPGKDTLQSRIPVPLDTALDTLRDKNNSIRLEIPVQGNITDPKFSVNDAISQALAKGVQKGALSYLTLALQPYGTLITAAKYAGEELTKVRLNPIEFTPGQSELDDGDREYLGKVAQVLKDRPNVAIKLCGVATAQDRDFFLQQQQAQAKDQAAADKDKGAASGGETSVDEEQLSTLAEQRAATVKDFLVERHGTRPDHLVGCLPQLELEQQESLPRADLLI
jgi:outer membrane protein OmpA-like peptidoglycan-associated protein